MPSLLFSADAHQIDHGSAASLDNVVPITLAAWIYATTIDTNTRRIAIKRVDATNELVMSVTSAGGNNNTLVFTRQYSTQAASSRSANNFLTTGAWQFVAAAFNGTNAPVLYAGTQSVLAAPPGSYITNNAPGGTNGNEAAASLIVGTRPGAANSGFLGRIAMVGMWNRAFSQSQVQALQLGHYDLADCRLLAFYGENATAAQRDASVNANHGAVTGAALHVDEPAVLSARRAIRRRRCA